MVLQKKSLVSSFRSIFMHADRFDKFLMALGFIGVVGDGLTMPVMFIVTSKLMNNLGVATTSGSLGHDFMNQMNQVCFSTLSAYICDQYLAWNIIVSFIVLQNALVLCYLAGALWVACFLGM